jgi:hypothetical protein
MDDLTAFKNLAELDALLRSSDPSTHYESLFYMPFLLKDHPAPAFIQAAFLKLADAFQSKSL